MHRFFPVALIFTVLAISLADARTTRHHVPYFLSASHPTLHSIVRLTWRSCRISPAFTVDAYDDSGAFRGTMEIPYSHGPHGCGEIVEFNSSDLENGNSDKGLVGIGRGIGDWQLFIESTSPVVTVSSYVSTEDGFLVAMHDTVPFHEESHSTHITTFNFADAEHEGRLRIINPSDLSIYVDISGQHDQQVGNYDGGAWIPLSPHEVITVTDEDLETYHPAWHQRMPEPYVEAEGPLVEGSGILGEQDMEYVGRWRLYIQGRIVDEVGFTFESVPLIVMHLMEDADTGILTNLSSLPDLTSAVGSDQCGDEYEQALAFTTANGLHNTSVPALWDNVPFVVDVSRSFSNANSLLDAVAEEADRIKAALGYTLIVPGEVRTLPMAVGVGMPQRITVHCCFPEGHPSAGTAYPWMRAMKLKNSSARHIIMHELYHLLGLHHPGSGHDAVAMSDLLMHGRLPTDEEILTGVDGRLPTGSTAEDLAKLGCIYE